MLTTLRISQIFMQMFGCSAVATLIQTVQVTAAQRRCVGVFGDHGQKELEAFGCETFVILSEKY